MDGSGYLERGAPLIYPFRDQPVSEKNNDAGENGYISGKNPKDVEAISEELMAYKDRNPCSDHADEGKKDEHEFPTLNSHAFSGKSEKR